MTFLVFSVFPAPDSPVQRIDWSSRSVGLKYKGCISLCKAGSHDKIHNLSVTKLQPYRIFLEMYPHLSLQLHFMNSKPQPLHCCCLVTLSLCHVCCIPIHNVHSVVNEKILRSKGYHLLLTHEIMAVISQAGSHDWCY
jgi:hypothetical protein